MLAIVSPAKKLDFESRARAPSHPLAHTEPVFVDDAAQLVNSARKLSRAELQQLMKLSDSLTDLNYRRFKGYSPRPKPDQVKQAVMAFAGDTYTGLDAATLDDDDLAYAQDHLRIISGLYGLLRPLDMIQPYRLEMGRRLNNPRGADLYEFWGEKLAGAIDEIVGSHQANVVVNVASNEYFKAVRAKAMQARVITPVFKEIKNGEARVLGLFA
ncbi:MAG: YaaA family protein, partial [Alphaproteobacteria bacterium]|nr:YaaA family protein [Alphaproteobacteria bacterium]